MAAKNNGELLHVLFLPYLSAGHIIPLVDVARLFASRGVKVTILTTPQNTLPFQSSVNDDRLISGHPISFETLTFPQVGLPDGIESFTSASPEMYGQVFYAVHFLLTKPFQDKIRELRPDAIFSDAYFPWTVDLAKDLNIPRIVYNLSTFTCYSIVHNLKLYKPHRQLKSEESSETFLIPGLPDKIEFKPSQLSDDLRKPEDYEKTAFDKLLDQIQESEDRSYGIVHNTFYELEPAYVDYYQKLKKPKCWPIGPLSLFSSKIPSKEVNSSNSETTDVVMEWLNDQKPKSVLYVSLGNLTAFPDEQLSEIAKALEASGVPFIWVSREHQGTTSFPDGFEDRASKSKLGLLVRGGRVPQLTILDHPATGGFMTNCETNSIFEATTAGVPLLTWPLNTDQFFNEKHMEILGLGVKVGSETWNSGNEISSPVLASEKIKGAIEQLMNGSEESREIRDKAMDMSKMAKNAISEGGSSWNNLTALIDDIKNFPNK